MKLLVSYFDDLGGKSGSRFQTLEVQGFSIMDVTSSRNMNHMTLFYWVEGETKNFQKSCWKVEFISL